MGGEIFELLGTLQVKVSMFQLKFGTDLSLSAVLKCRS